MESPHKDNKPDKCVCVVPFGVVTVVVMFFFVITEVSVLLLVAGSGIVHSLTV